jgi:hypothetical protein
MNEANNDRCRCNPCVGSECNCGCQQQAGTTESVAQPAACACGSECRCGSGYSCGTERRA